MKHGGDISIWMGWDGMEFILILLSKVCNVKLSWEKLMWYYKFFRWCFIKYILKLPARDEASHTCLVFLHCVFSKDPLNCLTRRLHNEIGCICFTFLRCVFSDVSPNCLRQWMHSHIGCICLIFLHCAFSNESHWKGPYGPLSKRARNYPTRMDLSSQREHAFVCNTLCNIRWFRSTSSFRGCM